MEAIVAACNGCKYQFSEAHLRKPCPGCGLYNDVIYCPACATPNVYFDKERNNLPYMGAHLCCFKCKTDFQYAKCPSCKVTNYWLKNKLLGHFSFQYGSRSTCYKCKFKFYLSVCPTCFQENYSTEESYSGVRSNIDCSNCVKKYSFIICPHCQKPNYTENTTKVRGCRYGSCQKYFYLYKCGSPTCTGFQYYASQDINEIHKNLGKKNFCSFCNLSYKVVFCPKCQEGVRLNVNDAENCYMKTCTACSHEFKIYNCEACWASSVCACNPDEHRPEHNICSVCKQKTITLQEKYKDYECKICFAELFEGYFDPCQHANCCSKCAMKLDKPECPVCKTKARYVRLKIN